jgi:hypothetical protein
MIDLLPAILPFPRQSANLFLLPAAFLPAVHQEDYLGRSSFSDQQYAQDGMWSTFSPLVHLFFLGLTTPLTQSCRADLTEV